MAQTKTETDVECEDEKCPFHGTLSTRGTILEGEVVSYKMADTVVIKRNYFIKSSKYERYAAAHSRISAHKPQCIDVDVGDRVQIEECRKLSKNVSFVVTKILPSD